MVYKIILREIEDDVSETINVKFIVSTSFTAIILLIRDR